MLGPGLAHYPAALEPDVPHLSRISQVSIWDRFNGQMNNMCNKSCNNVFICLAMARFWHVVSSLSWLHKFFYCSYSGSRMESRLQLFRLWTHLRPTPWHSKSTCLREMPFSTSQPITSFISTWKMRDYFPIPSRSTDGKSYAIQQECATLPFLQLSSTQELQTFGNPQLADKKEGWVAFSSFIFQFYIPPHALGDTLKYDIELCHMSSLLTSHALLWLWHFI